MMEMGEGHRLYPEVTFGIGICILHTVGAVQELFKKKLKQDSQFYMVTQ